MLWFSELRGAVEYACGAKIFPDVYGRCGPMVVRTMYIFLITVFLLWGGCHRMGTC